MSTINANEDIPPELHVKICKKIAQLTKVIYTLNTKAEEHETVIEKLNEEHSKEIQNIMFQCKSKVEKFRADCKFSSEKEKELRNVQEMLRQVREENDRLQKSLREHLTNTELNEKQMRNGYENKFLDLQNKFLTCKTDYSELLDSCNKNPIVSEERRQKEIMELTSKHEETIEYMKQTFERDIDILKADKIKFENLMNKKVQSMKTLQEQITADHKLKENEYESKIMKLQQFYEEELKQRKQIENETIQKEWLDEKANIISEFQITKQELSNRVRYLEKTLEEKEEKVKVSKKNLELLRNEHETCEESLSCLQSDIVKKDKEIVILRDDMKVVQNKLKVQGEKLDTAMLSNDNYRQIEEAYGEVSRNLDVHKKKLTSLKLEYSQLEEIHYELKVKLRQLEEDNTKLNSLCGNVSNEKAMEIDKTKTLEVLLEEKITLILSLENKIVSLEGKLKSDREKAIQLEKELCNMKNNLLEANCKIRDDHSTELNALKKSFAEKLKEVQNESSMAIAIQEKDFQNERETTDGKYNDIIKSKDELIDQIRSNLKQSESKLDVTKSELERHIQKSKLLTSGLEDKGKVIEETIDAYEQKISVMRIDFRNEKDQMKGEFEKAKVQVAEDHKGQLEKLEKKWQLRLKGAAMESDELAKHHQKMAEERLDKIVAKHQSELSQMKSEKDREIQELRAEIESFKDSIEELKTNSNDAAKKHDDVLTERLDYFKAEQEKLQVLHNNEMTDLKRKMEAEMDEKINELSMEKSCALESLRSAHEENLLEIRNEHLQSVKALRNQLNIEKEEAIGLARCQLANEKEKFHEILKVQTEEKINAITLDFEARLEESKAALEQSFQLRQQEFLVHSRKISELTNNLEEEKSHVSLLNAKINQAEEKEKYLINEVTSKGEEILEIRRESNSRLRSELDIINDSHRREKENIVKDFTTEKIKSYEQWEATKAELNDQVSSLKYLLDEMEDRFLQRPSREEDIEKLNDLSQKLLERELECRRLSEERKHYKLELVNREENFNKVFNNSPNVGYINPIELSKRKSSKKR